VYVKENLPKEIGYDANVGCNGENVGIGLF